jgi:hypothetical protein
MNAKRWIVLGIIASAAAAWYGWWFIRNMDTGGRIGLAGTVTWNREPLKSGRIQFNPARNTSGPAVSGPIQDGRYNIPAVNGVVPGTYEAELTIGHVPSKKQTMREFKMPILPKTITWPHPQEIVADGEAIKKLNFEIPP